MRNPKKVLNSLTKHSVVSSYKFEKLYRILFNPQMYYWACQYVFIKSGRNRSTLDSGPTSVISPDQIENLIGRIRDESYRPCPARSTYNSKGSDNAWPDIPALDDKLVQHIIRMILQAVYEKQFEDCSHGFRSTRSCHTALMQVKTSYQGVRWLIEGHIKGFFEHISHQVLIQALGERIADRRFIRLISKFLNAGYLQDWVFDRTYSGIPNGAIIGPVLASIYLDKLDKYIRGYAQIFAQGRLPSESLKIKPKQTRPVNKLALANHPDDLQALTGLSAKQRAVLPFGEDARSAFKELRYVRYADQFLIGVTGSIGDCKRVKQDLKAFLYDRLKLGLSEEKTLIVPSEKAVTFLSYQVSVARPRLIMSDSWSTREGDGKVVLRMPQEMLREKLVQCGAIEFTKHGSSQYWKPKSRSWLLNKADLEIISQYKLEIQAFYNYYCLARNSGSVNTFGYLMQHSMYKTLGRKYRLSTGQVIGKLRMEGRFATGDKGKENGNRIRTLCNHGFVRGTKTPGWLVDQLPRSQARHARCKKHGSRSERKRM